MTRARFRPVDIWAEDDPAVALLREGLALQPAPERPPTPSPAAESGPSLIDLRQLRAQAAMGDPGAVARLRAILGRLRNA